MFDYSPSEDVPWFDGALARLYEYFDRVPEVWSDAAEFMKVRQQSKRHQQQKWRLVVVVILGVLRSWSSPLPPATLPPPPAPGSEIT